METAPFHPDRRVAPRHCVALPLRCGKGAGITRDLSATGVYFLTDEPLELGQVVRLSMTLHHADPVRPVDLVCRGTVCRVEHLKEGPDGRDMRGVAVAADGFVFGGDPDEFPELEIR